MATIPEALTIAVGHHQGGRLQAAEKIYRQILAVELNHADAMHLLGVVALQVGKYELAIQQIGRAIAVQGAVAFFHNNMGEALRALRRMAEAAACYRRAIELMPDYAEAHNNLGHVLEDLGHGDEALACYHRALDVHPNFAMAHRNLGNRLWEMGRHDEAIVCCRRSLALEPNYAEAHYNLGNMLATTGNLDEAITCYRRALALKPDFAEAHNNYGNLLKEQGKLSEAVACYRRAMEAQPDFATARGNLAAALKETGNLEDAIVNYRLAIALRPDIAEWHNNLGNLLREQGNLDEALACYHRALDFKPDFAVAHSNLALALKDKGKLAEAVACYRRALQLKPDYAQAHSNLGIVFEELGDLQNAEASFRAALDHDPQFAMAHYKLAELLGRRLPDDDVATQRHLLQLAELTDSQRLLLHFGLAHVLDARGEYDEAAQHAEQGNALQLVQWRQQGQHYEPQEHERFIKRMMSTCTHDFFDRVAGLGINTDVPVFIVGLPRSGTTLVEQILAAHSQVFGAGELKLAAAAMSELGGPDTDPFENLARLDRPTVQQLASGYLERLRPLSPLALRITSKMPENYQFLGLLATLFPRAKFIHCRRDMRDVAVSCWMTHFAEMRWTNDHRHIVSRFHQYERIMEHWRHVLPVPLLEIDYEETVEDLEGVARRLVAWCDLEWEPRCLEFYRARRVVRTASAVQVRQPIYRSSVERWKNYAEAFSPLFAELEQTVSVVR